MKRDIYIVSSGNCLFHNSKRGIIRIYCPFKVICIIQVSNFKIGDELMVERVCSADNNKIIYIIQSKAYFHSYFRLKYS